MDKDLSIYQLNVQSADKLDERRDGTTRAYGGMCVVVTTAAFGSFEPLPFVSTVLWAFLIVVAFAWLATLKSLTAKLTAKTELLADMEKKQKVPTLFLTREREKWEDLNKPPLHRALRHAPTAFAVLGTSGFLGSLARVTCNMICH